MVLKDSVDDFYVELGTGLESFLGGLDETVFVSGLNGMTGGPGGGRWRGGEYGPVGGSLCFSIGGSC